MSTFLVLGRPRSRSAWVANLLTVPPQSFCLHEGLADSGANLDRLKEYMSQLPGDAVGNADTGLLHYLDSIPGRFPDARLVLLTGGDRSWRNWCTQNNVPPNIRARVDEDYEKAVKLLRGLARFVDCRSLTTDLGEARGLWEYCIPQHPFEPSRWRILKDLNVQVIPASLVKRLRISL